MNDLIEAIEMSTTIKSVTYDTETHLWTISYKDDGLVPDEMPSELLIDFLVNG